MSQNEKLRRLMRRRWVSALDAIRCAGCLRLAARVYELRAQGINVVGRWRDGNGKQWKEYRIVAR